MTKDELFDEIHARIKEFDVRGDATDDTQCTVSIRYIKPFGDGCPEQWELRSIALSYD